MRFYILPEEGGTKKTQLLLSATRNTDEHLRAFLESARDKFCFRVLLNGFIRIERATPHCRLQGRQRCETLDGPVLGGNCSL